MYLQLLKLYFPRTADEEEFSAKALPADIGNGDLCVVYIMLVDLVSTLTYAFMHRPRQSVQIIKVFG